MGSARHTFPECLHYGGHTNSPGMVWERLVLEQAQTIRSSLVPVDQYPQGGSCCHHLLSFTAFQLALGSVWNWPELGSSVKGENVMPLVRAEA